MKAGKLAVVALGLLTACSPHQEASAPRAAVGLAEPAVHPQSGLPIVPLTVTHAGQRHVFHVELARTEMEQARGLMFRTRMGPDEGMIFPMNPPRTANFWMHNTVIPLDIIFVGTDGRILNIANGVPYDETPLPSLGTVKGVLELNGGRAAQLGIGPGDIVTW